MGAHDCSSQRKGKHPESIAGCGPDSLTLSRRW
jgi:hypothetical protein